MLDYALLKLIWWGLVAVLILGFMLLGGRDLGVAALLPWIGKTDEERRLMLNSIGPTWEGNQVWFITAGGALFAAWPLVYSVAFSAFYEALLLVLVALILRPPGFDYRSKLPNKKWRLMWDWALFASGFIPSLLIGVALGNIFLGVPFHFNGDLRSFYTGHFFQLLHPFALLVGIVSLCACVTQAGLFLAVKVADAALKKRAQHWAGCAGLLGLLGFAGCGLWLRSLPGYRVEGVLPIAERMIPTNKQVIIESGAWLSPMLHNPWVWNFGALSLVGLLGVLLWRKQKPHYALYAHCLTITGYLATAGLSLFPFVLPSSSNPNHSLTIWDATSSHATLNMMFWVVVFFLPIVLGYTFFMYRVLRGPIRVVDLDSPEAY